MPAWPNTRLFSGSAAMSAYWMTWRRRCSSSWTRRVETIAVTDVMGHAQRTATMARRKPYSDASVACATRTGF
eukprot:4440028-Pyramimonas_sp.AAC.1